jgi:uncharacterized FAD-dependent dehydrogenase
MLVDYTLTPDEIQSDQAHRRAIQLKLQLDTDHIFYYRIVKRNIDARNRNIVYVLRAEVELDVPLVDPVYNFNYQDVSDKPEVHIIGAGPCGYFAALQLIESGLKPVIIERGKDVKSRRKDLRDIQQNIQVNPDSNYCFGEGGAGTYSDGKLYTRSDKRGNVQKILRVLIDHGAHEDILVDVHPHIGSNKLPGIVNNIRMTIEKFGGEVHFNTRVNNFIINQQGIQGIDTSTGIYNTSRLIMAAGHSARSLYEDLNRQQILIESKPYAIGVRIEHPQSVIDEIQYKQHQRHPQLPPSSYSLACQIHHKGVFSFCMCPGGLIIPAATSPGEIVVNGMSLSRRDSPFANSGIVTSVDDIDFKNYIQHGNLRGMYFQQEVEQRMFQLGDGTQKAPAQRLQDFFANVKGQDVPDSSYIPGLFAVNLFKELPAAIAQRLKEGLQIFCEKMPGYLHKDAVIVGTESRTSAPVRIPRDPVSCMHPQLSGFFPAGEGAGYAGGILSAAMDGQNVARAVTLYVTN